MLIFIKMKQDLIQKIKIPENTEVTIDGNIINVKGNEGEIKREFNLGKIKLEKKDQEIILSCKLGTKREKKIMNTILAHIENMLKGVNEKFEYKLKICFHHFPITVDVKDDEAIIKNFLGEKIPRKVKIPKGAEVKVNEQEITITSVNKEIAGQTAANFEKTTKIRMKDRRIFQDGIFITKKDGREI